MNSVGWLKKWNFCASPEPPVGGVPSSGRRRAATRFATSPMLWNVLGFFTLTSMEMSMARVPGKFVPPGGKMNAAAEARQIVVDVMALVPRDYEDNKSSLLDKAAGRLGITYWQAKKLVYREVKGVDADRLQRMRDLLNEAREAAARRQARANEIRNAVERHRSTGQVREADERVRPAPSPGDEEAPGSREGGPRGRRAAAPTLFDFFGIDDET
jgi:hypothetical protein